MEIFLLFFCFVLLIQGVEAILIHTMTNFHLFILIDRVTLNDIYAQCDLQGICRVAVCHYCSLLKIKFSKYSAKRHHLVIFYLDKQYLHVIKACQNSFAMTTLNKEWRFSCFCFCFGCFCFVCFVVFLIQGIEAILIYTKTNFHLFILIDRVTLNGIYVLRDHQGISTVMLYNVLFQQFNEEWKFSCFCFLLFF